MIEKEELVNKYPEIKFWIKPYIGARDFINRTQRWVLWLKDLYTTLIRKCPEIVNREKMLRNSDYQVKQLEQENMPKLQCSFVK